jgi:hypothetical protein
MEEAQALIKKMASSQSWNDECTQTRTRKVHQHEEADMLTTKIDFLMKKLEDLGLDHLKMVNSFMTCEECRETCHMSSLPYDLPGHEFHWKFQWVLP